MTNLKLQLFLRFCGLCQILLNPRLNCHQQARLKVGSIVFVEISNSLVVTVALFLYLWSSNLGQFLNPEPSKRPRICDEPSVNYMLWHST